MTTSTLIEAELRRLIIPIDDFIWKSQWYGWCYNQIRRLVGNQEELDFDDPIYTTRDFEDV